MPVVVELSAGSPQLARIGLETVALSPVAADEIAAPGSIEANPNRISHLSMPLPGRVAAVRVKLGGVVTEGQSLFEIESPEIEAAELAHR